MQRRIQGPYRFRTRQTWSNGHD